MNAIRYWIAGSFLLGCWACGTSAYGVTHESPEVVEVIEKGLKYLEKADHDRVGGKCLVALAFKKNGRELSHPKIKQAIDACLAQKFSSFSECDNYDLPLMIIFLCELEDPKYGQLIDQMLAQMLKRQRPNGSWTYDGVTTGDTSQTQYAVLAMWTAINHKHDVPVKHLADVLNWLLRTQDKGGGWGYQANDPGDGKPRTEQSPLTMSLGGAALGSIYMICDLVVPPGDPFSAPSGAAKSDLPPAMQEVVDKANLAALRRRPVNNVNSDAIKASMRDGNAFMGKIFSLDETEWKFYGCYAFERYFSFKEIVEKAPVAEPKWYNDMFADFKKHQQADGSWAGGDSVITTTSFAVLVLCRSTKKAIVRAVVLGEGVMLGGMGLPPDTKSLSENNGKLVDNKVTGNVDQLLNLLGEEGNPLIDQLMKQDGVVKLDGDITKRQGQIDKLRNVVTTGAPEARVVAVRSLAKSRNFDQIPILLFALGDRDYRVIREADAGLRFVSRRFDGVMNTDTLDAGSVKELRALWRDWYLSIKPDAELLD